MAKTEKRERRNLLEMQRDANAYALEVIRTVPLNLGDSADAALPVIHKALVEAWAAGYAARDAERSR